MSNVLVKDLGRDRFVVQCDSRRARPYTAYVFINFSGGCLGKGWYEDVRSGFSSVAQALEWCQAQTPPLRAQELLR